MSLATQKTRLSAEGDIVVDVGEDKDSVPSISLRSVLSKDGVDIAGLSLKNIALKLFSPMSTDSLLEHPEIGSKLSVAGDIYNAGNFFASMESPVMMCSGGFTLEADFDKDNIKKFCGLKYGLFSNEAPFIAK